MLEDRRGEDVRQAGNVVLHEGHTEFQGGQADGVLGEQRALFLDVVPAEFLPNGAEGFVNGFVRRACKFVQGIDAHLLALFLFSVTKERAPEIECYCPYGHDHCIRCLGFFTRAALYQPALT